MSRCCAAEAAKRLPIRRRWQSANQRAINRLGLQLRDPLPDDAGHGRFVLIERLPGLQREHAPILGGPFEQVDGIVDLEIPGGTLHFRAGVKHELDVSGRVQLEGGEVVVDLEAGRVPFHFFGDARVQPEDDLPQPSDGCRMGMVERVKTGRTTVCGLHDKKWSVPDLRDWFWGGRPLTGYHAWVFSFMALAFHLPCVLLGRWSWAIEGRELGALAVFWIAEDWLWFVLNDAFGIARFAPEFVPWHKHWLLGVPTDYLFMGTLGLALVAYSFWRAGPGPAKELAA